MLSQGTLELIEMAAAIGSPAITRKQYSRPNETPEQTLPKDSAIDDSNKDDLASENQTLESAVSDTTRAYQPDFSTHQLKSRLSNSPSASSQTTRGCTLIKAQEKRVSEQLHKDKAELLRQTLAIRCNRSAHPLETRILQCYFQEFKVLQLACLADKAESALSHRKEQLKQLKELESKIEDSQQTSLVAWEHSEQLDLLAEEKETLEIECTHHAVSMCKEIQAKLDELIRSMPKGHTALTILYCSDKQEIILYQKIYRTLQTLTPVMIEKSQKYRQECLAQGKEKLKELSLPLPQKISPKKTKPQMITPSHNPPASIMIGDKKMTVLIKKSEPKKINNKSKKATNPRIAKPTPNQITEVSQCKPLSPKEVYQAYTDSILQSLFALSNLCHFQLCFAIATQRLTNNLETANSLTFKKNKFQLVSKDFTEQIYLRLIGIEDDLLLVPECHHKNLKSMVQKEIYKLIEPHTMQMDLYWCQNPDLSCQRMYWIHRFVISCKLELETDFPLILGMLDYAYPNAAASELLPLVSCLSEIEQIATRCQQRYYIYGLSEKENNCLLSLSDSFKSGFLSFALTMTHQKDGNKMTLHCEKFRKTCKHVTSVVQEIQKFTEQLQQNQQAFYEEITKTNAPFYTPPPVYHESIEPIVPTETELLVLDEDSAGDTRCEPTDAIEFTPPETDDFTVLITALNKQNLDPLLYIEQLIIFLEKPNIPSEQQLIAEFTILERSLHCAIKHSFMILSNKTAMQNYASKLRTQGLEKAKKLNRKFVSAVKTLPNHSIWVDKSIQHIQAVMKTLTKERIHTAVSTFGPDVKNSLDMLMTYKTQLDNFVKQVKEQPTDLPALFRLRAELLTESGLIKNQHLSPHSLSSKEIDFTIAADKHLNKFSEELQKTSIELNKKLHINEDSSNF